jgi:mono/diheme cytochrome c family protein
MKRAALFLCLAMAACRDEPDRGFPATAGGGRQEPYAAIPPGTAPRGTGRRLSQVEAPGPPMMPALIAAGAKAYRGYCASCHGVSGRGDGPVTQKGFPRSPPLGARSYSAEEVVAIIGNGKGQMPPLAEQIPPGRRWAIAHYLTAGAGVGD